MKKITIGFSIPISRWSIQGPLLAFAMQTNYDHVYMQFDIEEHPMVFQANKFYVNLTSLPVFNSTTKIIKTYVLTVTDDQYKHLVNFAMDTLGEPYSFLECIGMGWVLFGRLFNKNWNNPFTSTNSYFCSELVCSAFIEMGINMDSTPNTVSPKDMDTFLSQYKGPEIEGN